jgi:uncharacterized protein involved in exopolysaccharide biosynthesis
VNDPYQTMRLPVTEFGGVSRDASPRGAFSPGGMPNPPKGAAVYPQVAGAEPSRLEPTVLGAVRRHFGIVLAVTVLAVAVAAGYSLLQPKVYRAQALITMPQASVQGLDANSGQYLDSQVILLQSQSVAQLAATIANAQLHSDSLNVGDFSGTRSSLVISPPLAADVPGAYGATVIGVSFGASTAQAAQVGTSAVIQAYDQMRSTTIRNQDNAAITGIDNAIGNVNHQLAQASAGGSSASSDAIGLKQQLQAQGTALVSQRAQVMAAEQVELAQQPAVAAQPATVTNHKWALDSGIGLVIGILLGSALAFVRAGRSRRASSPSHDPSPRHEGQPSSASDYRTATAARPQLPLRR